jgi:hypothetical protein
VAIAYLAIPDVGTAQNIPKSDDQQMLFQLLSTSVILGTQVIPSVETIILLCVPESATATNNPNSCDQHTEFQLFSAVAVREVHVIPSDEVIILSFISPYLDTAQNKPRS